MVAGISKFTDEIVRLGGRCDSEELEKYTLRNLRNKDRSQNRFEAEIELRNLRRLRWNLRTERNNLTGVLVHIEHELAKLQGWVDITFI